MPAHRIKVLTFDADGTIWDFQTTMREALAATLGDLKSQFPEDGGHLDVDDLLTHRQEAEAAFSGQSMTMEDLRLAGFVRTLDTIGVRDGALARRLTSEYLERRFDNARIFDDAIAALDVLKEHFTLGLLTNGNSYPDKLGVGDRFAFTLVAQEHGIWKPEPSFYEMAIERSGCEPHEIMHIGDSLENDVRPARRAGMQAVWLNRTGAEPPAIHPSVATLYSLDELPAFLGLTDG